MQRPKLLLYIAALVIFIGFSLEIAPANATSNIDSFLQRLKNKILSDPESNGHASNSHSNVNIIKEYMGLDDIEVDAGYKFVYAVESQSKILSASNREMYEFSAQRPGGMPLPSWLEFDASTLTFYGIPLSTNAGDYYVEILAREPSTGRTLSDFFLIRVQEDKGLNQPPFFMLSVAMTTVVPFAYATPRDIILVVEELESTLEVDASFMYIESINPDHVSGNAVLSWRFRSGFLETREDNLNALSMLVHLVEENELSLVSEITTQPISYFGVSQSTFQNGRLAAPKFVAKGVTASIRSHFAPELDDEAAAAAAAAGPASQQRARFARLSSKSEREVNKAEVAAGRAARRAAAAEMDESHLDAPVIADEEPWFESFALPVNLEAAIAEADLAFAPAAFSIFATATATPTVSFTASASVESTISLGPSEASATSASIATASSASIASASSASIASASSASIASASSDALESASSDSFESASSASVASASSASVASASSASIASASSASLESDASSMQPSSDISSDASVIESILSASSVFSASSVSAVSASSVSAVLASSESVYSVSSASEASLSSVSAASASSVSAVSASSVSVLPTFVNTPPRLVNPIANMVWYVGQGPQIFNVPSDTFIDDDGDELTYTLTRIGVTSTLPEWISTHHDGNVDYATTFYGLPTNAEARDTPIIFIITATDPHGASAEDAFSITVTLDTSITSVLYYLEFDAVYTNFVGFDRVKLAQNLTSVLGYAAGNFNARTFNSGSVILEFSYNNLRTPMDNMPAINDLTQSYNNGTLNATVGYPVLAFRTSLTSQTPPLDISPTGGINPGDRGSDEFNRTTLPGIIFAVLLFILILLIALYVVRRRRNRHKYGLNNPYSPRPPVILPGDKAGSESRRPINSSARSYGATGSTTAAAAGGAAASSSSAAAAGGSRDGGAGVANSSLDAAEAGQSRAVGSSAGTSATGRSATLPPYQPPPAFSKLDEASAPSTGTQAPAYRLPPPYSRDTIIPPGTKEILID